MKETELFLRNLITIQLKRKSLSFLDQIETKEVTEHN